MQSRLTGAARGGMALTFARDVPHLRALVEDGARAAIVDVIEADALALTAALRTLRARWPRLPIVAYCGTRRLDAGALLEMGRAGVTRLVVRDVHDSPDALRLALTAAVGGSALQATRLALEPLVPPSSWHLVESCVAHADRALTVARLAALIGVSRKTLALRLRRARLPSASTLIAWGRLLRATHLIEQPGYRARHAALEAGFPSDVALHNAARRHTGHPLRDLLRLGGFSHVMAMFAEIIRTSRSTSAMPRAPASSRPRAGRRA